MVTCLECNREFKRLNVFHLKTHGLDESSYRERHPGAELFSTETRELISRRTRECMREPEKWERYREGLKKRDPSRMVANLKFDDPNVRSKIYTDERNSKVSAEKVAWWADGRAGKKVEELWGEDRGREIRKLKSEQTRGSKNPAFGKVYVNCGRHVGFYKGRRFRSLYEYAFYKQVELEGYDVTDESQLLYEPFSIPYELDGRERTYHPDFFLAKEGILVEIKSEYALTRSPKAEECRVKHAAGQRFCSEMGYQFQVLTERTLDVPVFSLVDRDPDVTWAKRKS